MPHCINMNRTRTIHCVKLVEGPLKSCDVPALKQREQRGQYN
jgi:hypothetical protein